jgi:hypothetical protein
VAEWKFDENTGVYAYDASGNNNTGTLANGPTWVSGKSGSALRFDGIDDHVQIPDSSTVNLSLPYSITFWIKSGSNVRHALIVKKNTTGNSWNYTISSNEGGSAYLRFASGSSGYNMTTNIFDDKWHHIGLTISSGGNLQWYVDGNTKNSYTGVTTTLNNWVLCFGIDPINSTTCGTQYPFDGIMDNIRFYNYARTPEQIAWEYNRGAPVGHWRFDECSGTTAHDASGNANHGTIIPGPSGQTSVGDCTTNANTMWYNGRNGKFNSSLNFDGTDDIADLGVNSINSKLNNADAVTLSAWMKPSSYPGGTSRNRMISIHMANTYSGALLSIYGDNQIEAAGRSSTADSLQTARYTLASPYEWSHVVGIFDYPNDQIRLYLNGQLVVTQTVSFANNLYTAGIPTNNHDTLGAFKTTYNGDFFNGQIDDVRIYNYALTPQQIKTVYTGGAMRFGP